MTDAIKIEKGIPLPQRRTKYPLWRMDVGDSFFVRVPLKSLAPAVYGWGKRHGRTFSCRTEGDGVRVWRVK